MSMLCVDPGVSYYAWACYDRQKLVACGLKQGTEPLPRGTNPSSTFVIESQFIDRHSRVKTSDVIALAQAAGRIAALHPAAIWYTPNQWKGSVPKRVHQKRVLAALTEAERALLEGRPKKELVQVLDAIGLGLFHLGRLGR